MDVFYAQVTIDQQTYYVGSTDKGMSFVSPPGMSLFHVKQRFVPREANFILDANKNQTIRRYLVDAFQGQVWPAELAFDWLTGTPFQHAVWEALQHIPRGSTCDYSTIAQMIGCPSAVRAVANAIGKNPMLVLNPCHRVIAKNGTIGGFSAGLPLKRQLLALEGIVVLE
jgi:methylated-DNA-[protein]-cysteine S-methyltransferase